MSAPEGARAKGKLGIWMSIALVMGNMIGSGIFLLPASLALYGGISVLGWLFSSAGALLLALVFARLGGIAPATGGPYAYTRRGFGDFAGFLVAWGYWISIWCANAAIAVAFVGYLGHFVGGVADNPAAAAVTAMAAIWALTWVNTQGIRKAGTVQLVSTALKILPLVAVGTLGLLYFDAGNFRPFNASQESSFSAITASATLTLWAFLGLESATVPAAQVDRAERTIPRATLLGTLCTAVIYILSTVGVMGILSPGTLRASTAPFADAATQIWGGWAGDLVAAGAVVSCIGALNGWIVLQGQVPLAAADDDLFPSIFSRISKKGVPAWGLVISSMVTTILMATNYTRGLVEVFTFIILLATLTALVPYAFTAMAELMIFIKERERFSGKRLSGAVVIAVMAFVYALWAIAGSGTETVFWGFLLLMAGVPVYVWIVWRRERRSTA